MMLRRRGSAYRKYTARLKWLAANPELYSGVPGIHDDVTDENRIALDRLRMVLVGRNLLGATTPAVQRDTVRRLVSELRGEETGLGWQPF